MPTVGANNISFAEMQQNYAVTIMLLYVDIDKTKFTQCDVALKCGGKM